MLLSGMKTKIAEEVIPKALEILRKGLEDQKDDVEFELPEWLKDYKMEDFRMWIFEQTTSLFNSKFENVAKNFAAML